MSATMQHQSGKSQYSLLVDVTKRHWAILAIGLAMSIGGSLLSMFQPRVLETLVNQILVGGTIAAPAILLALLALGTTAVQGLQGYIVQRASESIAKDLRNRLVQKFLSRTVAEHDRANSADLLSRATVDVNVVKTMISAGGVPVLGAVVMVIGVSIFMITIDPILFLITLLAVALGILVVLALGGRARARSLGLQTSMGMYSSAVDRLLAGIRTIKAAGAEDAEQSKAADCAQDIWSEGVRLAKLLALAQPLINLSIQGAFLLVVVLGALRLSNGSLTFGEIFAFLVYLLMLIVPLASLGQAYSQLQVGFGALSRIAEIDLLEGEGELVAETTAEPNSPGIRFEDVIFNYLDGEPVLRGCTFTVDQGEHVALVGRSGSGKSTIIELIERFYEPVGGRVLIDGIDASMLSATSLRARMALVSQDVETLTGTVRDNLVPRESDIDDARLLHVLEQVGLRGPQGRVDLHLDTDLGQDGISLSGGQRQRLAWARLLLSEVDILLLDEATAHLDPQSEADMFKLLQERAKGKTIIMATHQEAAIEMADRVMVVAHGTIEHQGIHRDMLETNEEYRVLRAESIEQEPRELLSVPERVQS